MNILIADDHGIVRGGLKLLIDRQPDMQVIAETEDGVEAFETALRTRPDLCVMDVSMPRLTGLQAARQIKAHLPATQVLIQAMREAGIGAIQPGIESLSTNVLKLMKKHSTGMRNLELMKWCTYYDINNLYNILVGFAPLKPAEFVVIQIQQLAGQIEVWQIEVWQAHDFASNPICQKSASSRAAAAKVPAREEKRPSPPRRANCSSSAAAASRASSW